MQRTRKWSILAVPLVALLCGLGWWYWYHSQLPRQIPGHFTAPGMQGGDVTCQFWFSPDGTWHSGLYATNVTLPAVTFSGRWRLSGRMLVLEGGTAATVPVSFFKAFMERYETPIHGHEVSRFRILSANESRLILDPGEGLPWTLTRVSEEP